MGTFMIQAIAMGWLIVYFYAKVFTAIDTDGALKKSASEGFLGWLDRRLK